MNGLFDTRRCRLRGAARRIDLKAAAFGPAVIAVLVPFARGGRVASARPGLGPRQLVDPLLKLGDRVGIVQLALLREPVSLPATESLSCFAVFVLIWFTSALLIIWRSPHQDVASREEPMLFEQASHLE